ncbi:MAG: purine-cytosine permease family protein [Candidatus Limnocylindrales bacterium]
MQPNQATQEYTVAAGQGVDEVGKVETRGIDQIPESERKSNPRNMAAAFASVQFSIVIVFFGWLLVSFGLGFWSILTAVTVGVAIGSLVIAVMALSGPLTGTNQSVSSGAYFGVRGRLIGSAIALFIDVVFLALIAYTTGQTLVDTSNILFGTATGTVQLVIGMIIACVLVVVIGYFGHATLVASYKAWLVVGLIFQAIWVIVALPNFHLAGDGTYVLGDFLPTWLLAVTVAISIPISYITWPNDYGRRMPRTTNPRMLGGWAFVGMFAGCWIALMLGAFITMTFADSTAAFVDGSFAAIPTWFAIPLMLYGFLGNAVNGGPGVYNSALDLQALLFRARRQVLVLVIGVVVFVVAYAGTVLSNAYDSLNALVLIMIVVVTPWAVITMVGMWLRKGQVSADDLHTFAIPGGRGPYWFTGGVNYRAVTALVVGAIVGCLFSENALFTGPLASAAGGVDLSFISAGLTGGILYYLFEKIFPEHAVRALSS